jgi:hypothetical protein
MQRDLMTAGVRIELGHRNDPDFPRECVEVWQVVEEGATLASFDSREEAESYARDYCKETGAEFDEESTD